MYQAEPFVKRGYRIQFQTEVSFKLFLTLKFTITKQTENEDLHVFYIIILIDLKKCTNTFW